MNARAEYIATAGALARRLGRARYWHDRALWCALERLHPQTAGHVGLVANWGNAAARERLERSRNRWQRYAAHIERLERAAMLRALAS